MSYGDFRSVGGAYTWGGLIPALGMMVVTLCILILVVPFYVIQQAWAIARKVQ